VFWILAFTFFVCGWTTNGLVQTHFVPAAHDHGMPTTTAAGLLAMVGVFDIVGTLASGWLSDWADSRVLLAAYYGLRGASLLALQQMLAPDVRPSLWVFIVFYGLDWVATVPPTVALCRQHFGLADSGVVFGWVYASHMIGAGIGASAAGWIRTSTGSYQGAWLVAAGLCFAAAASVVAIRRPSRVVVVAERTV
jgi:predicted MFS family arabinose efflux permease